MLKPSRYVIAPPEPELRAEPPRQKSAQREPRPDRRRLVSKREAARRLGIDRGTTLQQMIDRGELNTVVVGGRVKIPVSEIDRIATAGTERRSPKRPPPPAPRSNGVAAAIRALKV